MEKIKKHFWSNFSLGTKPPKFKAHGKKLYSCQVTVYNKLYQIVDKIEIKFKSNDKKSLDNDWNNDHLGKKIPGYIEYTTNSFSRDRGVFVFVNAIKVEEKEYLIGKQKIERQNKLKRIINS